MDRTYPTPRELGLRIPPRLREDRYCAGFAHALRGGQLDRVECLRLSFREGYRAAKLYLKLVRRRRGVPAFPVQGRMRLRAHH